MAHRKVKRKERKTIGLGKNWIKFGYYNPIHLQHSYQKKEEHQHKAPNSILFPSTNAAMLRGLQQIQSQRPLHGEGMFCSLTFGLLCGCIHPGKLGRIGP